MAEVDARSVGFEKLLEYSTIVLGAMESSRTSVLQVDLDGRIVSASNGAQGLGVEGSKLWENCFDSSLVQTWFERIVQDPSRMVKENLLQYRRLGSRGGVWVMCAPLSIGGGKSGCFYLQETKEEGAGNNFGIGDFVGGKVALPINNRGMHDSTLDSGNILPVGDNSLKMLAHVLHEVRNNLNTMSLGLEFIKESVGEETDEENTAVLKVMTRSISDASEILNNTIDLSRLEHGMFSIEPAYMVASTPALDAVEQANGAAQAKRIELNFDAEDDVRIVADKQRLCQVFTNLLSNALKFTKTGSINVRCYRIDSTEMRIRSKKPELVWATTQPVAKAPEFVVYEVKDTGPGIASGDLNRLFHPFQQINASEYHNRSGAGLGLVITKRVVEAHEGGIAVESCVGVGTTFYVFLPCRLGRPTGNHHVGAPGCGKKLEKDLQQQQQPSGCVEPSATSEDPVARPLLHGIDLLLVEDDTVMAQLMLKCLKKLGPRSTQHFRNGKYFVDWASANIDPNSPRKYLTLMDDVMPVLSGTETLEALHTRKLSTGPVVMCSGNASTHDLARFEKLGAVTCLAKPISVTRISKTLEPVVKQYFPSKFC